MQDYAEMIETYEEYIEDYEISAFESVYFILHNRSHLEKVINELTHDERIKLLEFDLKLIQNAKKMAEYIGEIYDWSISKESINEFWWHLDLIAENKVTFSLKVQVNNEES
ncbi:hypothetical protein ABE096_10190 [Robertmurraya massiliosenegalensis]|uniref:hypothetical protein n=1 Tax=Robertmurraya TaxID=2837507 RepID=UPI0039A6A1B9